MMKRFFVLAFGVCALGSNGTPVQAGGWTVGVNVGGPGYYRPYGWRGYYGYYRPYPAVYARHQLST